ncbi:MAG: hypothetical protein EBS60_09910, partial [Verrucomicrobia bacterium]|nr:hypothetical protein [Verrucomicrobiota bacterium]
MAKRVAGPQKKLRSEVQFALNGQLISVSGDEASAMLGDFLRKRRSLTGTKIVCAEGDCGACTVLKAAPFETLKRNSSTKSSSSRYLPVNSCIVPVATLDGSSIVTVDGLATNQASSPQEGPPHQRPGLHPAQEAMIRCHGSQCGFCTPGMVMAAKELLERKPDATR